MSKFLHRDAINEAGAPSAEAFDAAERLGIVWPALPWTCPKCGIIYENHAQTIATLDLEVVVSLQELIRTAPRVLSELPPERYPKARQALESFVDWARADIAEHGPPAAFLCIMCDLFNYAAPDVVHVLRYGRTLCGLDGSTLPEGHKWARIDELEVMWTCELCKQLAKDGG